jgi:hypothetical protein
LVAEAAARAKESRPPGRVATVVISKERNQFSDTIVIFVIGNNKGA